MHDCRNERLDRYDAEERGELCGTLNSFVCNGRGRFVEGSNYSFAAVLDCGVLSSSSSASFAISPDVAETRCRSALIS